MVHVRQACGTRSCRFLEGNRNVCVVSAPLMVFGIDRQGKIDAVHTIVLVDDQGRVEKEDGCTTSLL